MASNIQGNPQKPVTGSVGEYSPLLLRLVQGIDLSSLWNQFIDRYHYLRFRVPFGANLRYLVESERHPGRPLACLLFSSPAWKMTARDAWIGWTENERRRNLQYVVSNSRFLILPWVSIRGLASKILSLAARRLPGDWDQFYGYRPLLLETLVDPSRFRGTCYRAANWTYLGKTQGRGRMDRDHQAHGRAVKDLYVFPLCRAARRRLREAQPPKPIESPEVKEPADFNLLEEATRVELSSAVPVGGMVSVIDWQLLKQCRLPERPEEPSARRVRQKGRPPDPGS